MTVTELKRVIANFRSVRLAVVGDMVADLYIEGAPQRLSREAPVVIARWEAERLIPGSAANTVHNLTRLGAKVHAIGVIGRDETGRRLKDTLKSGGASVTGLVSVADVPTVTKTRVMIGDRHTRKQQVVRVDREPEGALPRAAEDRLLERIDAVERRVDAWLVSDYGYQAVTKRIIAKLRRIAKRKVVIVDSRYRFDAFKGVTCITPNESEGEALSGIRIRTDADARRAGRKILDEMRTQSVLLTRGNRGMMLFEDERVVNIPICGGSDIVDVTGAGDTVAAVFALSRVAGASAEEAARLANVAASVVVMKYGAATVAPDELLEAVNRGER